MFCLKAKRKQQQKQITAEYEQQEHAKVLSTKRHFWLYCVYFTCACISMYMQQFITPLTLQITL